MSGLFEQLWHSTLAHSGARRAVLCASTRDERSFDSLERDSRALADNPEFKKLSRRAVLLHLENSSAWLSAFLALRRAGAVVVPVDADTPTAGVSALAARLRASAVFDRNGLTPTTHRTRRLPPELLLGKLTSGSTGEPRAFFFTGEEVIADSDAICAAMGIDRNDLTHAGLPFAHSYALGTLILPLFTRGVPIVVSAGWMPQIVAEEIALHRTTVLPSVPALVSALHRSDIAPEKLASLRLVITAGSRLDPEDARAFAGKFSRRVQNLYGSSETGGIAFDTTGEDTLTGDSVGSLLQGVSATRMRDGRLLVSGPAVRTHGNPRRRDGFGEHPLADLANIAPGGRIILEGRRVSLIKICGRRVNPAEVERLLRARPGVRDAFVGSITGAGGHLRLAALVAGEALDARALREALRESLPAWKVPTRIATAAAFPLTGRGKPDRAAMLRMLEES